MADNSVTDLTQAGDWLKNIAAPSEGWLSLGGPVALILVCLSIVSMAIVIYKILQFTFARFHGRRVVNKALGQWSHGDVESALGTLETTGAKTPKILRHAMQLLNRPTVEPELVREEVARIANKIVQRDRSFLRTLEVIGMVSPLLGLMGTVIGMINAFQQLELGGAQVDPSVLSGGIWTALLTTGIGLGVAIPTVLAYHFLDQQANSRARYLDDSLTRLFTASVYGSRAL